MENLNRKRKAVRCPKCKSVLVTQGMRWFNHCGVRYTTVEHLITEVSHTAQDITKQPLKHTISQNNSLSINEGIANPSPTGQSGTLPTHIETADVSQANIELETEEGINPLDEIPEGETEQFYCPNCAKEDIDTELEAHQPACHVCNYEIIWSDD